MSKKELEQISFFENGMEIKESDDTIKKESSFPLSKNKIALLPNKEVFQSEIPSDVLKNRSTLMDDVINTDLMEQIEVESKESKYPLNVTTRFSVAYEQYEGLDIQTSSKLTQFDREVLDAVATLAPHMSVISAGSIYRVITGKMQDCSVTKSQKDKVARSMAKLRTCLINIDITDGLKNNSSLADVQELMFNEYLLSYAEVRHKTPNGINVFYEIMKMPPLFRFAEIMDKISAIPLRLLDTPLPKTDGILSMQSFLLRSIEEMKRSNSSEITILWDRIYAFAEATESDRNQKKRVRNNAQKVLDWWIQENYIRTYESNIKTTLDITIYS